MKKIFVYILTFVIMFFLVSCKNEYQEVKYDYTISYNLEGGVLDNAAVTAFDGRVGLGSLHSPTKEGYSFEGWVLDGNIITSIPANTFKDVTLTAKWKEVPNTIFAITYELDGGILPSNAPASFDSRIGVSKLSVPTKEGYIFLGWYVGENLVTCIDKNTCENVKLTAKWEEIKVEVYFKITYVYELGNLADGSPVSYKAGEGCELLDLIVSSSIKGFSHWEDKFGNRFDKISSTMSGDITLYAVYKNKHDLALWSYNEIGFDGKGMKYQILVDDTDKYNPYSDSYSGSNKQDAKSNMSKVESSYNIIIEYVDGNDLFNLDNSYNKEGYKKIIENSTNEILADIYAFEMNSVYVPLLEDYIYELYDLRSYEGLFNGLKQYDINTEIPSITPYEQEQMFNDILSHFGNVYGYATKSILPDYFMYYNVNLVKDLGLEDPAELWLKGKWTKSKFDEYVTLAGNKLESFDSINYVLDMNYADAILGFVSSSGSQLIKQIPPLIYISQDNVLNLLDEMKGCLDNNLYSNRSSVDNVSEYFMMGKSLFHDGKLEYLKNGDYFNPSRMTFTIGVVPYPLNDSDMVKPNTTDDINAAIKLGDIYSNNYSYLADEEGNYITGLDLSESVYHTPVTDIDAFYFLKKENLKNNINDEIILNIFNDLEQGLKRNLVQSTIRPYYEAENIKYYLNTKFDRAIDIAVVMSCLNSIYYDPIYFGSYSVTNGEQFGDGSYYLMVEKYIKGEMNFNQYNSYLNKYKSVFRRLGNE